MPPVSTPAAPAGTTRIHLKYPVMVDGLRTDHLDIRRPKVRDVLHGVRQGGSAEEQETIQFASLAGVAPKVIEELDLADYQRVQKLAEGFLS